MRVAAIDIGTNTILMLIAEVERDGTVRRVRDVHEIARLGKDVDAQGIIGQPAFDRVLGYLQDYRRVCQDEGVEVIAAYGTSGLRDAANKEAFIGYIEQRSGIRVGVLTGTEEAVLTYRGTAAPYRTSPKEMLGVLDIGGGSTEIVLGSGTLPTQQWSRNIGAVRLTERFFLSTPPDAAALAEASRVIRTEFADLPRSLACRFLAVAGTPTTLAAMDLHLTSYDRSVVEGHRLTREFVESTFEQIRRQSVDEIRRIPQILPQRADILLAGVMIMREFLAHTGIREITVSDRGLRFGLALREAELRGFVKPSSPA